ncbi:helix-turn-helix domain-containing protein [Nocardia sp. NPDC049707]|uniref:TetR/AcrR family transcriptional regulator n=1 Tax=Nocardia sp. NPDC049707 TaxID=3154735 RepID=UPI00344988A2
MGTREDLLAAAKHCLAEQGYARTTVRDIVAASGANLPAVNYHFRSKDALLDQAMIEATGEAVQEILRTLPVDAEGDPADRLAAFWTGLFESFGAKPELWAANLDVIAQVRHLPPVRASVADGLARARAELSETFGHADSEDSGKVLLGLLIGVLVLWSIDPDQAPSGSDIARGLRAVAADMGPGA